MDFGCFVWPAKPIEVLLTRRFLSSCPWGVWNIGGNLDSSFITPRKLRWQWKIHREWRCSSCWKWGLPHVMLVFRGVSWFTSSDMSNPQTLKLGIKNCSTIINHPHNFQPLRGSKFWAVSKFLQKKQQKRVCLKAWGHVIILRQPPLVKWRPPVLSKKKHSTEKVVPGLQF